METPKLPFFLSDVLAWRYLDYPGAQSCASLGPNSKACLAHGIMNKTLSPQEPGVPG